MNLPQIQRILQEFEKQSDVMEMKEEMMNEAIDDALEDEGDEEERLVNRYSHVEYLVCNVIGIKVLNMSQAST